MPYRICKIFSVENGHMLSKHPGKCRFPHGHSRRVEVVLEASALDANDMVCDFKFIGGLIQEFIEQFDHAMCLNTADPYFAFYRAAYERVVAFDGQDPTSELMARLVFDKMKESLGKTPEAVERRVRVVRIRMHETATSWAEYAED
jgi:6-pyruvoyltetrahydropterin/6-carboxytetrahydropterin synthase